MANNSGLIRLSRDGEAAEGMSPWSAMPLVGTILEGVPEERFHRVFEAEIQSPTVVRAGVWEATKYAETLTDYPYNEIVFLLEGSISIIDRNGIEECFEPGDCFFLQKGFNGVWKQHDTIKIFHMTVDPQQT